MLSFERQVVEALVTAEDPAVRSSVEAFVDEALRDMPEPVRAGVLAESVLLGTYTRLLRVAGRIRQPADLNARLEAWEASRIGVLRQYPRLMRSLVLFGENELSDQTGTAA